MNRQQCLLTRLAEEASEVSQIALKSQQFGLDEVYEVDTNKQRIHAELNDLLGICTMPNDEFGFSFVPDQEAIAAKAEKVNTYFTYSFNLGEVRWT